MASAAKNVLLAAKWDESIDPKGYFMSEKMDGVRAYWSGSTFYSRSGNEFHAPSWFTKDLPKTPLDGELWCGRGLFQRCVGIVKTKLSEHPDWKYVTYLIFDAPSHGGKFEERYKWLQENIDATKATTYAAVVGHELCSGKEHLLAQLDKVLDMGGEGLMLRQAGSKYVGGRNKTLLKVKVFHDEEALVLGHEKGTGRLASMMGKIRCKLANGIEFKIGTGFSDAQRKSPPKVGSVVTFKFQETSDSGTPRFPVFLRERGDVTWAEVLENAKTTSPHSEQAKKKFVLKKSHTLLYTTVPSRDQETNEKIVTDDDAVEGPVNPPAKVEVLPPCRYGAACYQKNEAHLAQFSHPERPVAAAQPKKKAGAQKRTAGSDESGAGVMPCRWGNQCFRTAPEHLAKYSHDHAPEEVKVGEPSKKAAISKKGSSAAAVPGVGAAAAAAAVLDEPFAEVSEEADVPEVELERSVTSGLSRAQVKDAVATISRQKTISMGIVEDEESAHVQISTAELRRLRDLAAKYEEISSVVGTSTKNSTKKK